MSSFLCDTTWEIAVKKCTPPKGSKTRTSKVGWFFGWPSLFGTLPRVWFLHVLRVLVLFPVAGFLLVPSQNLFGTTNDKPLKRSSGMVISRQENKCETKSEENVEAILVRLLWDSLGWTACSLAMPCHNSGYQSQIPKSFLL